MRARLWLLGLAATLTLPLAADDPTDTFSTSLHATRSGKAHWYSAANGGFEKWTGVSIDELGCAGCHGPADADRKRYKMPYTGGTCVDCHASEDNAVNQDQCFSCHGRQALEARKLQLPDVHRDAGMVCWDCHGSEDMHGDGTAYESMLEPGAIKADCADCHETDQLPTTHATHDPHDGALHCTACHSSTVITCYNCHFESQIESRVKRAMRPLTGFVMLVNREKDGKVHPASFQSLTYKDNAFLAIGPYTPHATTRQGRRCGECHLNRDDGSNAAIEQYNSHGSIRFVSWNGAEQDIEWLKGVVPIPADYLTTLRMEYMTFRGNTNTPPGPKAGRWSPIGKDLPDGSQLFFASPLTPEQMAKLGFKNVD